jgi:hypothetical protein
MHHSPSGLGLPGDAGQKWLASDHCRPRALDPGFRFPPEEVTRFGQ